MRRVVNRVLALTWLFAAGAGCASPADEETAAQGVTSPPPPSGPIAGTEAPQSPPMGMPQPPRAGMGAPAESDDDETAEPPQAGSAGTQGGAAGTQGGAAGSSSQAGAGGADPTPPATPDPPDPFDPFAPDAAVPPLFPEPTPGDYTPSPDNPPECPAEAPENPIGPCVGLPVYLECSYGTYFCVCDWIHWLCAG